MKNRYFLQSGQALLTVLVFTVIAMTVIFGTVSVMYINAQNTLDFEQGSRALTVAESGVENALIRLLRDPTYNSETLSVGSDGQAIITVSPSGSTKIITSIGISGKYRRKIQAAVDQRGVLIDNTWKEAIN